MVTSTRAVPNAGTNDTGGNGNGVIWSLWGLAGAGAGVVGAGTLGAGVLGLGALGVGAGAGAFGPGACISTEK